MLTQAWLSTAKGQKWLYKLSSKANTSQHVAVYKDVRWEIKKQSTFILQIENIILKPTYVDNSSALKKLPSFAPVLYSWRFLKETSIKNIEWVCVCTCVCTCTSQKRIHRLVSLFVCSSVLSCGLLSIARLCGQFPLSVPSLQWHFQSPCLSRTPHLHCSPSPSQKAVTILGNRYLTSKKSPSLAAPLQPSLIPHLSFLLSCV